VLVHHSFPDEIELANGVGTFTKQPDGAINVYLVTQDGASSVTNPEPGVIAEEVNIDIDTDGQETTIVQYSNLVPLGQTVMIYPSEYEELVGYLWGVANWFEGGSGLTSYTLEYEYKKVAPGGAAIPAGGLAVKQVRRIPELDDTPVPIFLINEPTTYCTFQGESSNVYSIHRLRSRFTLETRNMWLTEENLQEGLYDKAHLDYAEGCQLLTYGGPFSEWPLMTHSISEGDSLDGWSFPFLQNPRTYSFTTPDIPTGTAPAEKTPLVFLSDFLPYGFNLRADYETPVLDWDGWPGPTSTYDSVPLRSCPTPDQIGPPAQVRSLEEPGVCTVTTTFYWPPPPTGGIIIYTAPLIMFVDTVIEGLTTAPIVLTGEFAQSHRPGHHNFSEFFVFEPGRDPGLTQQQRDELAAADVRLIYMDTDPWGGGFLTLFSDEEWGDLCLEECVDGDTDGLCAGAPMNDCDDADPGLWARPGEVRDLTFIDDYSFSWVEPALPGATSVLYDSLMSTDAGDFLGAGSCLEWDISATQSSAPGDPPGDHEVWFYLARAVNGCPGVGNGSLGEGTGGERLGVICP
jgi:hypothetical protein